MDSMRHAGWLDHPHTINQALCFGTLPPWLDEVLRLLPAELMPPELGARRPLFDHMLVRSSSWCRQRWRRYQRPVALRPTTLITLLTQALNTESGFNATATRVW